MSDDLEDLLNDLSAGLKPAPSKNSAAAPQKAPSVSSRSQPSVGDDLEALMADLSGGRTKSVASPSSADELELLMEDLAAPSKPRLAPAASAKPAAAAPSYASAGHDELDGFEEVLDDDALDGILNDLAPAAAKAAPKKSTPAPKTVTAQISKPVSAPAKTAPPAVRATAEPASVDDGLEALLGDLSSIPPPKSNDKKPAASGARNQASASASIKANDSALDALMADLAGPAPRPPGASANSGTELESLMAELSSTPAPKASNGSAKAAVKANDNELDALMADLSSGSRAPAKASVSVSVSAPPAQTSDEAAAALLNDLTRGSVVPAHPLLNTVHVQKPQTTEIDRLMNDLNAVSAPQSTYELDAMMESMRGNPAPHATLPVRTTAGAPTQADLNALMSALGNDPHRMPGYGLQPTAPVVYQAPAPAPSTNQKRRSQAPSNAELDALMTSLKPNANARGGGGAVPGADLDVLMADLNSSKARANHGGGAKGGDLDAMLANLNTTSPNSAPAFKMPAPAPRLPHGICSGCRKFIAGEMVQAMGRCYHPDHFTCTVCSTLIGPTSYFEQEGQPLCPTCYHKHFSPPCARCGEPIAHQLLTALGKRWHPECFVCTSCGNAFPGGQFFDRNQMPFCPSCYQNPRALAAPPMMAAQSAAKCKGCGQGVVMAQALQALDALWHPEHFVCATCRKPFVNGQFYELSGQPVCPADYERATTRRK